MGNACDSVWAQLDHMQAEHDRAQLLLRSIRAGKLDRKPNGTWFVAITDAAEAKVKDDNGKVVGTLVIHKRFPREVTAATPTELVLKMAVECCHKCGCDTGLHATREQEGGMRCAGERRREGEVVACACTLTPESIRQKQGNRKWLAERLKTYALARELTAPAGLPGYRSTTAGNVFDGLRDKPVEASAGE